MPRVAWVAPLAGLALVAGIAGLPLHAASERSEHEHPRVPPAESTVDAVRASPDRFRTLLENDHVRVLEYTLRPGERDQWHTHPPKVSYAVRGGRLRILRSATDLNDAAEEVSPNGGTLLVFRRSDNSWHGHEPFEGQRRAIQMNWVTDEEVVEHEQRRHRFTSTLKKLNPFGSRATRETANTY